MQYSNGMSSEVNAHLEEHRNAALVELSLDEMHCNFPRRNLRM